MLDNIQHEDEIDPAEIIVKVVLFNIAFDALPGMFPCLGPNLAVDGNGLNVLCC